MVSGLPVVFSSNNGGKTFWSNQCNCACPTYDFVEIAKDQPVWDDVLSQPTVYQDNLTPSYKLLFNQVEGREVVVLNDTAYAVWERFVTPTRIDAFSVSEQNLAQQLFQLGLLQSPSRPIHACQSTPDALNVWLHITNACNLHCSYCYVNKSNEHMSLETGKMAIDAAFRSARLGGFKKVEIKFAGGEPTLRLDDVFQMYAYAQQKTEQEGIELDAVILSNGAALDQEKIDEIKTRGLRLMLSLDGIEETHNAQRPFIGGKGSYQKVWQSVERAIKSGLRPFISITITEDSIHGLPNLMDKILELGLPFNLNFARPIHSGALPDIPKMISALQETFHRIEMNLPEYNLLGSVLDRAFFAYPHERPCGVGENYLVIDQHGKIASCQMTLSDSITDVTAADPLSFIRAQAGMRNPNVDKKEGCQQCEWRYMCAGGCPLTAYHANGRYDTASPFCEVYKILYSELLRLEGLRILKYNNVLPV